MPFTIFTIGDTFTFTLNVADQNNIPTLNIVSYDGPIAPKTLNRFHSSPSSGERSPVGRVGLRNLGNTCYVNSCLQQLFTLEPLRNGLLSLGEGDTDPGRCGPHFIFVLKEAAVLCACRKQIMYSSHV